MNSKLSHPKGLYLLFVTEMAERFSYYGMRALFVLYLVAAFFNDQFSSKIYGSYTGLVYLTPLIGGYIADRYWGNRRSILVGSAIMAIGQFLMFASACVVKQAIFEEGGQIDPSIDNSLATALMFLGLGFLIIGNGFFKPNISTMVGDLYEQTDTRKDAAFSIFYMGINVGAFIAPLICGTLGNGNWMNPSAFKWGFFCAGVAMVLSMLVFYLLKDKYLITPQGIQIGVAPKDSNANNNKNETISQENNQTKHKSNTRLIASLISFIVLFVLFTYSEKFVSIYSETNDFLQTILLTFNLKADQTNIYISSIIYSISLVLPVFIITDKSLNKTERARIGVIYIIAVFVIFFWSAFEQAGASLTIFAERQVDRTIGNWEMPTTWFQSINPIVVVIFAPIMAVLWQYLSSKGKEPFSPAKQAIGLLLLAIGYIIIAYATYGIEGDNKVSMWWLVALYFVHTIGELCLSPIGLSMVNKLSPARFASLLMGVWLMSNAASNILAGELSTLLPGSSATTNTFLGFEIATLPQFFMLFAIMAGISAIALFCICPLLKKMMNGIK